MRAGRGIDDPSQVSGIFSTFLVNIPSWSSKDDCWDTLLGTNISPKNAILKMIFLFPFGGICFPPLEGKFIGPHIFSIFRGIKGCQRYSKSWLENTPLQVEFSKHLFCKYHYVQKKKQHSPIWVFPKNRGTPKSSILIGFSIINHPFWGTFIFGNTQLEEK